MIEALSDSGWIPLARTPPVPEHRLALRGLAAHEAIRIGNAVFKVDRTGQIDLRLHDTETLKGHVGLLPISDLDGGDLSEVDVVPGKMSQAAFDVLRSELRAVWGDLVLNPFSPMRVRADLPPAAELMKRIERSLHAVFDEPREHLAVVAANRRLHQCRSARELTPNMVRRSMVGLQASVPTMARVGIEAEATLVADTLDRLGRLAIRQGDLDCARRAMVLRRHRSLAVSGTKLRSVPWGARTDSRYRQIYAVWRLLNRPELEPVIGPGELRLGVRALPRLYEYWVFLKVLRWLEGELGAPIGAGYAALARPAGREGLYLDLPVSTEVRFPGQIRAVFEPRIDTSSESWASIEYVSHPIGQRSKSMANPDLVVLRDDAEPAAVVFDAKYIGRGLVERSAVDIHDKYARMRLRGSAIVTGVCAVHPYRDLAAHWAGYGHLGADPALEFPDLGDWLAPLLTRRTGRVDPQAPHRPGQRDQSDLGFQPVRLVRSSRGLRPRVNQYLDRQISELQRAGSTDWATTILSMLEDCLAGHAGDIRLSSGVVLLSDFGQLMRYIEQEVPSMPGLEATVMQTLQHLIDTDERFATIELGSDPQTDMVHLARKLAPRSPQHVAAVVYDQGWMESHRWDVRPDMALLRGALASRGARLCYVVGSSDGARIRFHTAAKSSDWSIWPAADRTIQLRAAASIAQIIDTNFPGETIAAVSDDPAFLTALGSRGADVEQILDLDVFSGRFGPGLT